MIMTKRLRVSLILVLFVGACGGGFQQPKATNTSGSAAESPEMGLQSRSYSDDPREHISQLFGEIGDMRQRTSLAREPLSDDAATRMPLRRNRLMLKPQLFLFHALRRSARVPARSLQTSATTLPAFANSPPSLRKPNTLSGRMRSVRAARPRAPRRPSNVTIATNSSLSTPNEVRRGSSFTSPSPPLHLAAEKTPL